LRYVSEQKCGQGNVRKRNINLKLEEDELKNVRRYKCTTERWIEGKAKIGESLFVFLFVIVSSS
jgi:hypothetical protein